MNKTNIPLIVAVGIMALYTISLSLPGLYTGGEPYYGYEILYTGAIFFIWLPDSLSWYPNALLVAIMCILITLRKRNTSRTRIRTLFILSLISVSICVYTQLMWRHISLNEGGVPDIDRLTIGFYVWSSSFIIPLLYSAYLLIKR